MVGNKSRTVNGCRSLAQLSRGLQYRQFQSWLRVVTMLWNIRECILWIFAVLIRDIIPLKIARVRENVERYMYLSVWVNGGPLGELWINFQNSGPKSPLLFNHLIRKKLVALLEALFAHVVWKKRHAPKPKYICLNIILPKTILLLNRYQQYLTPTLCDLSLTTPSSQKNRACMYECLRLRERARKRGRGRERTSEIKRDRVQRKGKNWREKEERENESVWRLLLLLLIKK